MAPWLIGGRLTKPPQRKPARPLSKHFSAGVLRPFRIVDSNGEHFLAEMFGEPRAVWCVENIFAPRSWLRVELSLTHLGRLTVDDLREIVFRRLDESPDWFERWGERVKDLQREFGYARSVTIFIQCIGVFAEDYATDEEVDEIVREELAELDAHRDDDAIDSQRS